MEVMLPGGLRCFSHRSSPLTTDTLVLASGVDAGDGATGLDLGCGSGASTMLASRAESGQTWIAVERDTRLARIALSSFRAFSPRGVDIMAVNAAAGSIPSLFGAGFADCVITNPPYRVSDDSRPPADPGRGDFGQGARSTLATFIAAASHCLRKGGLLHIVMPPLRLADVLLACGAFDLGARRIQPVGVAGRPARLLRMVFERSARADPVMMPQRTAEEITADPSPVG